MPIQVAGVEMLKLGNLPANADQSSQYLLLRLLLGCASIARGGFEAKQTIDYSSLPAVAQRKTPSNAIKDFLTGYLVGGSVERFIRVTRGDNREFYREILSEFLNFYLHSAQAKHVSAFVFLYRILERISYSVPLLYASTQHDYVGTFRDLRAILNADVEGELGLFKKFLAQGRFIDPLKLQVAQTITFTSQAGHHPGYFSLVTSRFNKFASLDPVLSKVDIKFIDISDFLVTVRNRFFHARTGDGRANITTIEMADPDEFFSCMNGVLVSFLAVVVLHTISSKYQV